MKFTLKFILIILFIFVSSKVLLIVSLSTTFCDHSQFQSNLIESLECWNEYSNSEVESLFSNSTEEEIVPGCETVEKVTSCFVDNVGTCFSQEQNADGILLMNFAFSNYGNETRCERNGGVVRSIIENNIKSMFRKYLAYAKNEKFISSIFTLDSNCTLDDIAQSLLPDQICLTRLPLMVQNHIKRINGTLNNAKDTIRQGLQNKSRALANISSSLQLQAGFHHNTSEQRNTRTTAIYKILTNSSVITEEPTNVTSFTTPRISSATENPKFDLINTTTVKSNDLSVFTKTFNVLENQSFPLCKAIDDTLHCIRPNDCVSTREINLLKKVIFKIYKIGMEHGTLLMDKLGGIEQFYRALGLNNKSALEIQPIVPAIIQLSSIDFKVIT